VISRKTSFMVYGRSGVGKSTQARYIAEYIAKKSGKKTRYIALDRGSLWSPLQDLVDSGIVIPLEFQTASEYNPMAIMRKLRRGEFPENGVINMPERVIKNGKVMYNPMTKWLPWTEKETAEIGAIVVDSITSFATSFMSDAKQKNIRMGGESGAQPREEEGEISGTNTQTHYGDAHLEVLDAINAFQALPVEIAFFTALEDTGTDDSSGTKKIALGPATVGKAIVSVVPQRVQNNIHLTADGIGSKRQVKAWYQEHPSDIASLQWPAKIGLLPHELPEFWKAYPQGFIPLSLERGIAEFLEWRDVIRERKGK
jgi:hypothetical protein